jgi:predicted transposase/invertase (TIGR01784 family)
MKKDKLPYFLPPKVDVVFKMLFGDERNKDLTIKFISSVLGYKNDEIKDLIFTDPHLKRETLNDKLEVLDVKAKLSNGEIIDIEMQTRPFEEIRNRISYYQSNMITEQIGKSNKYSSLRPVKNILITGFDSVPESEKCHTIFQMLEKEEHFRFNDLEEIHILNLKKLSKLKEEDLHDWLYFIGSEKEEQFMQVAQKSPILAKAVDALSEVSADDYNRMLYEARLKEWRDNESRINSALNRGIKKGEAIGVQKAREELFALLDEDTLRKVKKQLKLS